MGIKPDKYSVDIKDPNFTICLGVCEVLTSVIIQDIWHSWGLVWWREEQ